MIWKLMASKPEYAFTCTHTQSDGQAENSLQAPSTRQAKAQDQPSQLSIHYSHYTGQPALAGTSSSDLEDTVGANFYCPHALADGNQCIRIRQKTMEFSSTVLSILSSYSLYLGEGTKTQ